MNTRPGENSAVLRGQVTWPTGSVELVQADFATRADYLNEFVGHWLRIVVAGSGETTHRCVDGKCAPRPAVRAGEVSFYPSGTTSSGCFEGKLQCLTVKFQPDFAEFVLGRKGASGITTPLGGRFDYLSLVLGRELARVIITEVDFLFVERVTSLLVMQLSRLQNCAYPSIGSAKLSVLQMAQVLEYIDENLEKPITLSCLATRMGISLAHFSKLFKNATGLSPYRFITERRVERARSLLEAGHHLVEIAHEVGFNSQSHLTTQFKRVVGPTPGQYRSDRCPARKIHHN